jgi:hypothetical protein
MAQNTGALLSERRRDATLTTYRKRPIAVCNGAQQNSDEKGGIVTDVETLAMNNVEAKTLHMIERVHHLWNEALARKDADAAAALYAPDTILESPLVRHLLKSMRES